MAPLWLLILACGSDPDDDKPPGGDDTSAADPLPDSDPVETDVPPDSDTGPPPKPEPMLRFGKGRPPANLLMISIDTLRRDHVDRYGKAGRMPFLTGLAAEGFAVDDMRTCSNWTGIATSCFAGGRDGLELAEETGTFLQVGLRPDPGPYAYPEGTPFLARWLGDGGFYTMLVTSNPTFGTNLGNGQGYDETEILDFPHAQPVLKAGGDRLAAAVDRGMLDDHAGWFLHLHLFDPHKPYGPPESYLDGLKGLDPIPFDLSVWDEVDQAIRAVVMGLVDDKMAALIETHMRVRYEGEVRYLDDQIAQAWTEFEAAGMLDDTLVVFWSDHGESFFEKGLGAHANLLNREENDAIWLMWANDIVQGSTDVPATAIDLAPTLLDLYGLPRPKVVTGLALDDIPPDRVRHALSIAKVGPVQSADQGSLKVHWAFLDPDLTNEGVSARFAGLSVFDLAKDPLELDPSFAVDDPDLLALWTSHVLPRAVRTETYAQRYGFEILWPDELPSPE